MQRFLAHVQPSKLAKTFHNSSAALIMPIDTYGTCGTDYVPWGRRVQSDPCLAWLNHGSTPRVSTNHTYKIYGIAKIMKLHIPFLSLAPIEQLKSARPPWFRRGSGQRFLWPLRR